MNLKSLMLTSAILISNGVTDIYSCEDIILNSNNALSEYIVSTDYEFLNVWLSYENEVVYFNVTSDYAFKTGEELSNTLKYPIDKKMFELVNLPAYENYDKACILSYIIVDNPNSTPSILGYIDYQITLRSFNPWDNVSFENSSSQIYQDLGSDFSDYVDMNIDFDFLNNTDLFEWINLKYFPKSFTSSFFGTVGDSITGYVSSITGMFQELIAIFYADNKLTYLSQLLLVGIGIGITKWGMNYVKDRVRL